MRKIIAIFLVFSLSICSLMIANATESTNTIFKLDSTSDQLEKFDAKMQNFLRSKINAGENVYYGVGTTNPYYLAESVVRGIKAPEVNLPADNATFDFNMSYNRTYYSPFIFKTSSSCTMKIFSTCTSEYEPTLVNLQVVDNDTDRVLFDNDIDVGYPGTTLSVPLSRNSSYHLRVTALDRGNTHASFVVYGN